MIHCCSELEGHLKEGEVAIICIEKMREYGLRILDGGSSFQIIRYCPWCGGCLPSSLRVEWHRRLEAIGKESNDELPAPLQTDAWWRSAGL